jgi:hypothetical protein
MYTAYNQRKLLLIVDFLSMNRFSALLFCCYTPISRVIGHSLDLYTIMTLGILMSSAAVTVQCRTAQINLTAVFVKQLNLIGYIYIYLESVPKVRGGGSAPPPVI